MRRQSASRTTREITVMERALRLLARRARSEAELRERLQSQAGVSADEVSRILQRLADLGFLNDGLFAYQSAAGKLRMRPLGRARIERELRVKKLPQRVVEKALEQVYEETSEEEQIDRAIERLVKLRGRPRTREESKKLYDRLVRLGFPYELAMEKVKSLGRDARIELDE